MFYDTVYNCHYYISRPPTVMQTGYSLAVSYVCFKRNRYYFAKQKDILKNPRCVPYFLVLKFSKLGYIYIINY